MATSKEIKEEYTSSLADLTFNSKPLISVLTMLAEENVQHARDIVEAIETHLTKVRTDVKLPVLYLIDCIIKNVGGPYLDLFCQNIVPTFCSVFQSVDERTRAEMFKLRQTWNDYLPPQKLYALDVQIQMVDPAWPLSAKPPSSLIHVNPKFLNSTNNANVNAAKKTATNAKQTNKVLTTTPVSAATTLDPETLDMQQKLITKQKQLIELQQRKLELELLQAQVKLQEQLKNSSGSVKLKTSSAGSQANPLLKPEVAKQLVNTTAANKLSTTTVTSNAKPKPTASQPSSAVLNQRQQNSSGNAGPKIAAPNSALIAASRPIRDPRLRRQQHSVVNSNVQLEPKPQVVDSTNKIVVNSKTNVRDNRTEPRSVVTNKDNTIVPSEKLKSVPRPFPKSRTKLHDESLVRKLIKSHTAKSSDSDSKGDSSSKSSSSASSLESSLSPSKVKRDKKPLSPAKSPLKFKKRDADKKVSPKQLLSPAKGAKAPAKGDLAASPTFKDIKQSMKHRNYIRRNRKTSESPEAVQDVDLRLGGPPEKQARPGEPVDDKSASTPVVSQGMDVDLRQLPSVISKKRSSTEHADSTTPKKSKTEMFDVLFGNEDTDLRQLPAASPPIIAAQCDKPPTPPPPPIISSRPYEAKEAPKKSNLDVLRAKLNNATMKDRLAENNSKRVDVDLRNFMTPQTSPEKPCKIVITPDDEQSIKADKLTADQKNALWSKIVAQMNNGESAEGLGNISLQPISDEEMEGDFSEGEEAAAAAAAAKKPIPFGDKDDRVPPLHLPQGGDYQKAPFYNNRSRTHPGWRGRRPPKYYDGPHARAGARQSVRPEGPWMRNATGGGGGGGGGGPWRPMGQAQNYPRAPSGGDGYAQSHRAGGDGVEFLQDGGALDGAVENVSSHMKGRPNPWMRGNGPWRTMNSAANFNSRDNYAPMQRPGEHGEYIPENVPSPDANSNSPHLFQSVVAQQPQQSQPNLGNLDMLSSVISSATIPQTIETTPDNTENTQNLLITQPSTSAPPSAAPPPLNITELLQKLMESGIVTTTASDQTSAARTSEVPSSSNKSPVRKTLMNIKPVTFSKPETLKVLQPTVYQLLYTGMQCSSCGMRFPPEQSMLYSQHLDWHFRQNRKGKKNIRKAASRRWYYTLADWKNYEEIEDLEEREKNYFDQQQARTDGATEETEEEVEIPTVPADPAVQDAHCEICQDRFEQFYNEEKEEWQLRNAMRVNNKTYHPLCYEDYQTSLNIPIDISASENVPSPKNMDNQRIPGLAIILDDDDESENKESKTEPPAVEAEELSQDAKPEAVVEEEKQPPEEVEEEEDDDDDVILNEVAPERIILDDDDDNEEMTEYVPMVKVKIEPVDDGFMDVDDGVVKVKKDGEIKIKTEPKDLDDSLPEMEEPPKSDVDTKHTDVHISIDGNVEFDTATVTSAAPTFGGKIKINISKPLPALQPKEAKEVAVENDLFADTFIDPSQPLPPGEEPVQLNVKPALQGVDLKRLPPVQKGKDDTALCSIM